MRKKSSGSVVYLKKHNRFRSILFLMASPQIVELYCVKQNCTNVPGRGLIAKHRALTYQY